MTCRCRTAWSTSRSPTRPRPSRSPSSTCRTSRARSPTGSAPTSALLRTSIPENRLRVYDVRAGDRRRWPTPARCSSCGREFGLGMVTALARVEGRPVGVDRQQPDAPRRRDRQRRRRQGGAVHAAVRRVRPARSCSCATRRGSWSGPRSRRPRSCATAAGMFVTGANLTVPFFTIVLRKGYGLGAQAMAGGSFKAPLFTRGVADRRVRRHGPRGRGAARLPQRARGDRGPGRARARCSRRWSTGCTSTARRSTPRRYFEIDDVIDPPSPARWIVEALRASPLPPARTGKKRPCVDTW